MAGPASYLILPDPEVTRARLITSTSFGSGRFAGPPVASDNNQGDLLPFLDGTPTADQNFDLRIHTTGGLEVGASWGWKYNGDTGNQWRGQSDDQIQQFPHDPFADDVIASYGVTILVSEVWDRVILLRYSGAGVIFDLRYRSISAGDLETWASASLSTLSAKTITGTNTRMDGFELPDGSMRLFAVGESPSGSAWDIDVYGSTDGGLTWTTIDSGVLEKWTGASSVGSIPWLKVGISGDWIRLVYVDTNDGKAHTILSTDRCASWSEITEIPTGGTVVTNGHTDDPRLMAFCGVGTADGTFVLALVDSSASAVITWYTASRDGLWAEVGYTQTSTDAVAITAALVSGYIYFHWFVATASALTRKWRIVRIDRRDVNDLDSWQYAASGPWLTGAVHYLPAFLCSRAVGPHLMMAHAPLAPASGLVVALGVGVSHLLGWTRQSLYRDGPSTTFAVVFSQFWSCLYGAASLGTSTPWALTLTGAGTAGGGMNGIDCFTGGGGDAAFYTYDDGAAPSNHWPDASVFVWQARISAGGVDTADTAAARIIGYISATEQTDISYRMTSGGTLAAYDNIAGATLAVFGGLGIDAAYRLFRVGHEKVGAVYRASIWSAPATTDGAWSGLTASTYVTLSVGASGVTDHQIVQWGNLVAPAASCTSRWREFGFRGESNLSIYEFSNPADQRGRVCSSSPVPLAIGLRVRWAGGSGFYDDTFEADLYYGHGIDALFTPSPQMDFRSASFITQSFVFDADETNGFGRWDHDSAIAVGLETSEVLIQYNGFDSWGAPAVARTLSGVVYSGKVLSGVDGDSVTFASNFNAGELTNLRMRISTVADPNYGQTVKITRHDHASRARCEDISAALTALGFAAGTTVTLFRDVAVLDYGARTGHRFMRVQLPAGLSTATGDTRIGALGIGTKLAMDVPLDWEWGESDVPNVAMYEAASGLRVSYRRGESRRTLTASTAGGEVTRYREKVRDLLRHVAQHSNRPMGLVLDGANAPASAVWCRWAGTVDLPQQGWVPDSVGTWRAVGEMSMAWEEEL